VHVVVAQLTYTSQANATVFASDEQLFVFTYLYECFQHKIHKHVYRLLSNHQDAEDITQEAFLRAYKKWHTLYDQSNLLPWLYLVATHLSIDILRQRRHISPYISIVEQNELEDEETHKNVNTYILRGEGIIESTIAGIAEREHIRLALDSIPTRDAYVLILSAEQGLPYQEIALKLAISPGAAATCITRAKKKFVQEYRRIHE